MPIYVYKCDACGLTFEHKQSVNSEPLKQCPECAGQVQRVIQPVGIVFKGSGWYVNDSRSHNATTELPNKASSEANSSVAHDTAKTSEPTKPSTGDTAKTAKN